MIPVTEQFWSLVEKADRRFSLVRDLPIFGRNRNDLEFHKAFKIYTQLWKLQQENRQRLVEAGMRRWEVGEIASRIAQLYYGQYQRTSDVACLAEAYVFYEAILDRDYFRESSSSNSSAGGGGQDTVLANKQLRFLARFLTVCLVIGRREMVTRLANQLKTFLDDCRKTFQEAGYKEWKQVMQEIAKFLKADTPFMNKRPLRYNFAFDTPPDSLPPVGPAAAVTKRNLLLRDALLSSHYPHEVKFTELTLDTFRMLQCLEWDPCGSFAQQQTGSHSNQTDTTGPHKTNMFQDLKDPSLPPNPHKTILYRPSATHFLTVLATKCEELPGDGILLIYLSAAGNPGVTSDNYEKTAGSFRNLDISSSSDKSPGKEEPRLWLGYRANEGSSYVYPCDLIPFTRRSLFLIIDSCNAHAFKSINGQEKGEMAAMLLSPILRSQVTPNTTGGGGADPTRQQNNGSQFTMFLTAPLQAFCFLIGKYSYDFDMDKYMEAEKLLSLSLSELEATLVTSAGLHVVWVEALGDPFLRRFLLRFIFCRAALALFKRNSQNEEFTPTCLPSLPGFVNPGTRICQAAIRRLAVYFDATDQFDFSSETLVPPVQCADELSSLADDMQEQPLEEIS